ncbi:MAG: glycosyltransferase family 4 protein [Bryobacteraceae bacterium]
MSYGSAPLPTMLMARELGPGGTERQLTELARSLDPSRFEVHVGCFREGIRADELRRHGIPILRLQITSFKNPRTLSGVRQLISYLRRHKIRLVHTFDYPLNCFGVPVARLARVPVVLSSQRADRHLVPHSYLKVLRMTDRLVSGMVVNSEAVRSEIVRTEHVPASLLHLCYNGIDTRLFHSDGRRRVPALIDASLVIGLVCVLRPEKDVATLIEAFAHVLVQHPNLRLVIVGSGPELARLKTFAQEARILDHCIFQPAVSDVPTWLRSIDIFVLPSTSEAFSNSLMEAMACGCACIASRTGGNPELIRDDETGLLFEPADSRDLAEKLCRVVDDAGLRTRLAHAGARAVRDRFSLAASVTRMQEIYAGCFRKELIPSAEDVLCRTQ